MQGYVWTVRAVRIQDAPDDCEKITDSAIFKSRSNCGGTISFTELLTTNVRMCNSVICRSRMRLDGNNAVRTTVVQLVELIEFQLNLKRTQVDILQGDWLCNNRDVVLGGFELDVTKFLLESIQFIEQ